MTRILVLDFFKCIIDITDKQFQLPDTSANFVQQAKLFMHEIVCMNEMFVKNPYHYSLPMIDRAAISQTSH
jgi:hypothetical protein